MSKHLLANTWSLGSRVMALRRSSGTLPASLGSWIGPKTGMPQRNPYCSIKQSFRQTYTKVMEIILTWARVGAFQAHIMNWYTHLVLIDKSHSKLKDSGRL